MPKEKVPWNRSVLYHNYPWSFNEDEERSPQLGNGSIKGITEKIPYLIELGIDAIWISPPYPGPMHDAGYDTTDITDIHPSLGTLENFDELVAQCHENGIRVMLDFIPNHTSDQHEWFQKSRNREPGYEDWYIWHPGKTGKDGKRIPPNNWASVFSKPNRKARDRGEMPWLKPDEWTPYISAWQWDDTRGEYYLHMFEKEQPDLNWRNPKVVEAMLDSMHFWLERGVDGFRLDAVNHMAKNFEFPDEQINTAYNEKDYSNPFYQLLLENSSNYMPEYRRLMDFFISVARDERYDGRDIQLIIESYMGESLLHEINNIDPEVASTFNFGAFRLPWDAIKRKVQMDYYYQNIPEKGLPNQVNGNHDNPRLATRLGDAAARAAAVVNLFLPGLRIVYNGEELGLHDGVVPEDRIQDPNGLRDAVRMPMVWDDTKINAGFSNANADDLWLPVNENDMPLAANRQEIDPKSSLSLYKAAIELCRELPAVREGRYVSLKTDNDEVLAYGRTMGDDHAIVLTNFSPYIQHVNILGNDFVAAKSVLSSVDVKENLQEGLNLEEGVHLQPQEALVLVPTVTKFFSLDGDKGEELTDQ